MGGRKIYRSLLIIPYALPGYMTALVWKGMFNETYGINRWLPLDIPWQSSRWVAMFSLILVNLWLGYPYMLLVTTGALQSIPTDLKEAALVDGANGCKAFRKITFPLLLVTVSPLLIASFAFNFNNFALVWLFDQRQPARQRRERRLHRHPAVLDVPRRPRRQPAAPGAGRRAVRDHLRDRRGDLGVRVQVHQAIRGGEVDGRDDCSTRSVRRRADQGGRRSAGRGGRWFRRTGWRHVVGVLALFFALFPVWFVVIAAFSESASLSSQTLWPESFTLKQLDKLLDTYPYWQWIVNSLTISFVTASATVLLAASAAFAFSRLRFRGRRPGLLSLLLIQMFPASLAFVAIYIMVQNMSSAFSDLGAGSMATIVLFYLGGALGVNAWLIKGFFDTIPRSLDESAKIDGATHAQIFWRIILPLAAPVLAIIFLLSVHLGARPSSSSPRSSCSARTSSRRPRRWPPGCRACSPATATTSTGDRSPSAR